MKKEFFSVMAAFALVAGFSSCSNDETVPGGGEKMEIVEGEPTTMQFTISMPGSVKTYADADANATDSEIAINKVNVLVYAQSTSGTIGLESNDELPSTAFEVVAGTKSTYKLKDADKIKTTTGAKKVVVAVNYPGTLPTVKGTSLSELDGMLHTLTSATQLSDNGIAMFCQDPEDVTLTKDESTNEVAVAVKRMVAKVTVQEKLVRTGSKIMSEGGELTNLQFALGQTNKTIFAKQKREGAAPSIIIKDNNWALPVVAADYFTINPVSYKAVDAESTDVLSLKAMYAPENTAESYPLDGSNATYISVRAQYAPAFFADATGANKGAGSAKTFWVVSKNDGTILYFDAEKDATDYAAAKGIPTTNISAPYTDGFCYFRAYINKDGATETDCKPNKYDVLRNFYFKAMIKSIKAPGSPVDNANITEDTKITISVDVNPWTTVDNEYDL